MSTTTLAALRADYAARGDAESLGRIREAVLAAPGYRPGLELRTPAATLSERGDHAGVVRLLQGEMPAAFFSPAVHGLLAQAHAALGQHDAAAAERATARLALASITGSGSGTRDEPWSVLRVSDEYDVLASLGLRSVAQRVVTHAGRTLDVHRCDDGSSRWFDVTALTGRGGRR